MAKTTIMEADGKVIITTELDMSKLDETVAKLIETTVRTTVSDVISRNNGKAIRDLVTAEVMRVAQERSTEIRALAEKYLAEEAPAAIKVSIQAAVDKATAALSARILGRA